MNETSNFDFSNFDDLELQAEEQARYRALEPDEFSGHYQDWERNR